MSKRHNWTEINRTTDRCEKCGTEHKWMQNYTPGVYGGSADPKWVYIKNGQITIKNPGCK